MKLSPLVSRFFSCNAWRGFALGAGMLLFPAVSQATVTLSSSSFPTNSLPTIQADAGEISAAQASAGVGGYYKLRAKIIVPFDPGYYHAIDSINNNGYQLTSVPGAGSFTVHLYWAAYNSSGVLQNTGTFYSYAINITAPGAGDTGLKAEYFSSMYFTNLAHTAANGETPDYSWGTGGPPWTGPDNFSVRWTGAIEPLYSQTYTFTTGSDDGMRVFVANMTTPVAGAWWDHGYYEAAGTISLVGGQRYEIKVEFYENGGGADARLFWESPSQQRQIVPVARLIPPEGASTPPAFTSQPQSQTVDVGTQVTFSVGVSGSPQPSAQWYKNGAAILGATGFAYTIPSAQLTDAGNYWVVVTNAAGTATSGTATLTVNSAAGPGVGNGLLGTYYNGTSFNSIVATRTDAQVDFSWGSGTPIGGVGVDNFSVRWTGEVEAPVAGSYRFSTNSDDGVRLKLGGSVIIDDWTVHGSADRYSGYVTLAAGSKTTIELEYFESGGGANVQLYWEVPGQGRTLIPQGRLYSTGGGGGWQNILTAPRTLQFTEDTDEEGNPNGNWSAQSEMHTFTVPSQGTLRVYTTGNADTEGALYGYNWNWVAGGGGGGPGGNFHLECPIAPDTYRLFVGGTYQGNEYDSYTLYVDFLPAATSIPPTITSASNATFTNNVAGSFNVTATGTPAPTFSIAAGSLPAGVSLNATTGVLSGTPTITGPFPATFPVTIQVSNSAGTNSQAFTLTVVSSQSAPAITTQPANAIAVVGALVTFTVAASGSPAPTYQWQSWVGGAWIDLSNSATYAGVTTTTMSVSGTTTAMDGHQFRSVATNSAGSATSNAATLTVTGQGGLPVIAQQPQSQTAVVGGTVTFSVAATGNPTPIYEWKRNGISFGWTTATITLAGVTANDNGTYIAYVTNSAGTVASNPATLTVGTTSGPQIVVQPVGRHVPVSAQIQLTVSATGTAPIAHVWKKNGVAIQVGDGVSGVNMATLTITGFTSFHEGTYTVVVSNSAGSVTSDPAVLTLSGGGGGGGGGVPVITSSPVSQAVAIGSPVSLSVTATSSTAVTYQWKKENVNITGATSATLAISSFQPTHTGSYTVTLTNTAGSVTTVPASLAVVCSGGGGTNAQLPGSGNRSPYVPGLISSTVGGSGYDIQTGSIIRSVHDFSVTGSVGAYPLEMRRVYVAENKSLSGSGWAHSFVWFANENVDGYWPSQIGVQNLYLYTPEGQSLHFRFQGDDTPNEFFQTPDGTRVQVTRNASNRIDTITLRFPDGGTLAMAKYRDAGAVREFRPTVLTDPFGLVTTFSYSSGTTALPQQVTDASGRWLKFFGPYVQNITRVESSDGKWINLNGANGVAYWDGTSATYTRTELPGSYLPVGPGTIVMRFTDVRQTSAMRDVEYVVQKVNYAPEGPWLPGNWGDDPFAWEVLSERYPGTTPGTGTIVSSRTVHARQQAVDGLGSLANGPAIRATETRGDGAARTFNYGGSPSYRMSSATDFGGNSSTFSDWFNNVPSKIRDPLGNLTTVVSGSYGEIQKVTHPDAHFRDYGWTGQYLTSEKDERAYTTFYDRDAQNRVYRIRYPDSTQETYTYNARNQVTSHTLRSGATEHWEYNASGLKTTFWPPTSLGAVPAAPKSTYTYYPAGHASQDLVQTEADPRSNITTFEYNARNQVTKETLPDGAFRAFGYDAQGNRLWADNELGQRTSFTYDEYNRLLTTTNPLGDVTTHNYQPTAGGSALSHTAAAMRRTTLPTGRIVANRYDNDYHVIETIRGEGTGDAASVSMTYDAAGRLTQRTEQVDTSVTRVTGYRYDSRHRKTHEDAPLSRTTEWQYDPVGNVTKIIHPDGTFATKAYDAMNRAQSSTDERGYTTGFTYHPSGKLHVITDPRTNLYTHAYNSREQLTSRIYPGGSTETWEYDAAGNRSAYLNRSSQRLDYTHDARNRETQRTWVAGAAPAVTTGYDNASRVTSRSSTTGSVAYGYDGAGRMTTSSQTVIGRPAISFTYGYDNDGGRTSFSATSGQALGYGYNHRGALTGITQGGATVASYAHYGTDQRRTRTALNGTVSAYLYDGAGRLTSLNTYLGVVTSPIFAQRFGYDLRDRRTWTLRDENLGNTYEYFPDSQLQRYRHEVSRPDVNFNNPAGWTDTFAYDASGNRTSLDENGTVTSYAANSLNQYTSVTGATVAHGDGRGNLTQWNTWSYTFDAENRLVTAAQSGVTLTFSYDAEGRLAKIDRNGTAEYRYYDGPQCFLRTDASGNQIDWTVWGPTPDEAVARQVTGGAWQYYHHDPLNGTVAVTDAAGAVLERYLYDPFGDPDVRAPDWSARPAGTALGNPWHFTGQEWRGEMGLMNYKNRWHHPRLGRFLQTDPVSFDAGDFNLYRYTFNDPINHTDPDGTTGWALPPQLGQNAEFTAGYWLGARNAVPAGIGMGAMLIPGVGPIAGGAIMSAGFNVTNQLNNIQLDSQAEISIPSLAFDTALGAAVPAGLGAAVPTIMKSSFSNAAKGWLGEKFSYINGIFRGRGLPSARGEQVRLGGRNPKPDFTYGGKGTNGKDLYVEAKFGGAGLSSAQRAGARAAGENWITEYWTYQWLRLAAGRTGQVWVGTATVVPDYDPPR